MDFSYTENQIQCQGQRLLLTVEMRESLEILQMPLMELQKKVEEEIQENPVLEYDEDDQPEDSSFCDCPIEVAGDSYQDENSSALKLAKLLSSDIYTASASSATYFEDNESFDLFTPISDKFTFKDSLLQQLSELKIDRSISKICRYLIEDLDSKGYLSCSLEETAHDLGLSLDLVKKALTIVQQMQPVGVGAADLRECLTLQLRKQSDCNEDILRIVRDFLGLLAANKIRDIAKRLSVSIETAQKYCNRIKHLNPIPSSGFNTQSGGEFVIPEAIIIKIGNDFMIQSNHRAVPHLCINPYYRQMLRHDEDKEATDYLKDKIKRATSIIREISNRGTTISRVLEKIVELQKSYFENGVQYLKPMTIAEVAIALQLNESTVSRAIHDKYITCSSGTISLKSLFTSKICTQHSDHCFSSSQIKEIIRALINHEDKSMPISDQGITQHLQKRGIDISRRTVAKYRDVIHLPAAKNRRIYILK